jgi:hypothetical protein
MPLNVEAKEAAKFVQYEMEMLYQAAMLYQQMATEPAAKYARNCLLESFLMHARVLYECFLRRDHAGMFKDNILALDYFDDDSHWPWPWRDASELLPILKRELDRLHKSLPHLSYERIRYEPSKEWAVADIFAEVRHAWNRFRNALPTDRRAWFSDVGPTLPKGLGGLYPGLSAKTGL